MIRLALVALLATPAAAQEAMPLADLLRATHIHGIAAGNGGPDTVTLATHNGLFAANLIAATAVRIGTAQDDFMGYSATPQTGTAYASGHPATGGNIGVIRTQDGGATWQHVADAVGGPVDFHNIEVSRADPSVIFGVGHDGAVQRSADGGLSWEVAGQTPERLIDIATSATDAATIYAATEGGLSVSRDNGATWAALTTTDAPVTTVDSGADGVVRAVVLGLGLVAFDAAGVATTLTTQVPDDYLLFLASTHADPHRMVALSAKGRLVVSDDGGATWADAATLAAP